MSADVLIAGAGPVGLTLAGELLRHGVTPRIVDKALAPATTSRALVLWARTLELLDQAGTAAPALAIGVRARGIRLYADRALLAHVTVGDVDSPMPPGVLIPQNETERILHEHLVALGGRVERGVELVAFAQDATSVRATLRHPDGTTEETTARWLVGCDGAHSVVRHGLGLAFQGVADPDDWILADVHVDGDLPADEMVLTWGPNGPLAFFPIAPGRFRVIGQAGHAAADGHRADPTLEEIQQVVTARGPAGLRCHDPLWLSAFRINERQVERYGVGRVFLAGDAAHVHSPAGGQGMNLGMQDAVNLAWKLAYVCRGAAPASLLDSYDAERRPVGAEVIRRAAALTRVGTLRQPLAARVRDALAPRLTQLSRLRRRMIRTLTQLDLGYGPGPVAADARPLARLAHAPHAGERVPDCALRDVTDAPTTLHALRRTDPGFLLLAFPGTTGSDAADAVVRAVVGRHAPHVRGFTVAAGPGGEGRLGDPIGEAAVRLGATEPSLLLIRPDGHLGWRGPLGASDALRTWLGRVLG